MDSALVLIKLAWAYVDDNWVMISFVWLPAINGYWNGSIAFSKAMGWTRLANWCGKVEDAVQAFVQTCVFSYNLGLMGNQIEVNTKRLTVIEELHASERKQ